MATVKTITKTGAAKKHAVKKPVPVAKPKNPRVVLKSEAEDAGSYRVTGRIRRNGKLLRPDDTVELSDREAFALRGFIEPTDPEADEGEGSEIGAPTE
jgi:hypothetical protein